MGPRQAPETRAMLSHIHSLFVPHKTLRLFDPQELSGAKLPSWLEGSALLDGKLTVYVCHNFTCSLPVTEWEPLKESLLQEESW